MNQEEFQVIMKYAPYLMFDEKEPFLFIILDI